MKDERLPRLYALLEAAKKLADPQDPLGREARERLPETTGLSPAGVALALERHLEHRLHRGELASLVTRAERAPRSHVLLSANVFSAAFRAIALALAQTTRVFVRASRREAVFPELLHRGSGEAFSLVSELAAAPGDHYWAYGNEETLREVRERLPFGVTFHAHGAGMGAILVAPSGPVKDALLGEMCAAIARDVVAFDQKGCLSPRLVLVEASRSFAEMFADGLARALDEAETRVPRGALSVDERADLFRFDQTMTFVGGLRRGKTSLVALDPVDERLYLPPSGRSLTVAVTRDPLGRLTDLVPRLTTVGVAASETMAARIRALLPGRRIVELGEMQRPLFDGPVDGRPSGGLIER